MTTNAKGIPAMELRTVATVAAGIVRQHGRVHDYQPGNGTSYKVLVVPLAPGEGKTYGCEDGEQATLVALPTFCKSAIIGGGPGAYLAWSYVGEKLDLRAPDAILVAELLGYLLDRPTEDASCVVMP